MTVTKMVLLDKYTDGAIDAGDFISVAEVQDFVGLPIFEFSVDDNEFLETGAVATISVNEEDETLTINDVSSYFDDYDFDYEDGVPTAVYILEIDDSVEDEIAVMSELGDDLDPELDPELE